MGSTIPGGRQAMIAPEVLDALLVSGATAEMIVAAVKADAALEQATIDARRAKDAARQRRHRESRDVTVTNSDSTDLPSPQSPPNKVSPDPFKITPPIPPKPSSRGSRLPSDFSVPGDWIEWAIAKRCWSRPDAQDEGEIFVRYWQAKPGKDAVKLDWFKTWQNWVGNSRRQSAQMASGGWDGMP